jgi:hypothetical protein
MKKHTGSTSLSDFMGWSNGKWSSRPIRIFRNIASLVIVLSALGLVATGFMRCDFHPYFC